jgi:hypothetical protein
MEGTGNFPWILSKAQSGAEDTTAVARAMVSFIRGRLARAKAVLKTPHSRRWREGRGPSNRAERLECGAFTAAVARAMVSFIRGRPARAKAVLKTPHSRRWRECHGPSNRAERLEMA